MCCAACCAVLPAMAKAKFGRVLFIQTSYTIGCPPKNTAAYVMAKSAIGGLVKSLAVEYARFGVTVNCVAPSMMETNFLKDTHLTGEAGAEVSQLFQIAAALGQHSGVGGGGQQPLDQCAAHIAGGTGY